MKGPHWISLRLTIFVSLAVISGGILTWPFVVWMNSLSDPEEFRGLNALGLNQAQYVVAQSLRRGSDGVAYVETTPELSAYKTKNPKFRYAAFDGDSGSSLPGSDVDLVAAIQSDRGHLMYRTSLRIGGDSGPVPSTGCTARRRRSGDFRSRYTAIRSIGTIYSISHTRTCPRAASPLFQKCS